MEKWISVKDGLPKYGERVLLIKQYNGHGIIHIGNRSYTNATGENYCQENGESFNHPITHWMPLPETPKP